MPFKKTNLNNKPKLISNIIGLMSIFSIFLLGYIIINSLSSFDFKIEKDDKDIEIINIEEKNYIDLRENKKESDKKINILIVGRGGGSHDAPNLTDTIILAGIDTKTNIISMISIPRDLYVEYPDNGAGKINGIYAKYSLKNNSKNIGMNQLKKKVSEITGEKIDYYINVDFKGFQKIIDTIGGIQLTIPKQFIDNEYPDGNWGYRTLIFKKGTWIFNGENTLKYVRSRHSTSDFDRSIRQQQVIKSIKDKLTGSYFLTSPGKIKELYEVIINHVHTDISFSIIVKLAYQLNSSSNFDIISSNLNDSCFYGSNSCTKGGLLYVPNREFFGGMSVLLAEGTDINNLNNYKKIHKFTNIVFNHPRFFIENYKINIFNSLSVNHLAGALGNDINKYGFNLPGKNSIGNTKTVYNKTIIYYNNISPNSETLKILKTLFNGEFKEVFTPVYSKSNANIEIIIGQDYLGDKKIFNF